MKALTRPRLFAVALFLALATLTAGFSYAAMAQNDAGLSVLAPANATCDLIGEERPATKQGDSFAIEVRRLQGLEPVFISLVFPDGRVFSPTVAQVEDVEGAFGLDGVIDKLKDPGFAGQTNSGGDFTTFIQTTGKWPYGCYKVIAQGVTSKVQMAEYLVITEPAPPVARGGPLELIAQSHAGQQPSGEQGVKVDVFGRRFMSGETVQLRMIQPNGTIIALENMQQPVVSAIGSFQVQIELGTQYQTGEYTFVAASGNGQSVAATFTLKPQAIMPRGYGQIHISKPVPSVPVQEGEIQLQGKLFEPGEGITTTLILPNGARRRLDTVQANQLGEFFVDLTLDRQLPTGIHTLLVTSPSTVITRALQLNAGPGVVPVEAAEDAITGASSDDGLLQPATATPDAAPTTPSTPLPTTAPPAATVTPADPAPPAATVTPADPAPPAATTVQAPLDTQPSAVPSAEPSTSPTTSSDAQSEPTGGYDTSFYVDFSDQHVSDLIPIVEPDEAPSSLTPLDPPALATPTF